MGIGLALVAKRLGLECILCMPESMSVERRKLLSALGAKLVLTSASGGMSAAVEAAQDIAAKTNGYITGQFVNEWAVEAHYLSTGPEIFTQTNGNVSVILAGVGSGSSLTGTGKYLKEHISNIKIIAVEPKGSAVLSTGQSGKHLIQGIGAGFIPKIVDLSLFDEIVTVDDQEAIQMAKNLALEEGIICGISSGANVACALRFAKLPEFKNCNIVTFICDSGERYLSTALFQ